MGSSLSRAHPELSLGLEPSQCLLVTKPRRKRHSPAHPAISFTPPVSDSRACTPGERLAGSPLSPARTW